MKIYRNLSFDRSTKHRGEHGNAILDPLKVVVPAGAEAGDQMLIDTGTNDMVYTSISLQREALTAGLTVDVGVRDKAGSWEDPDYFAAAVDLSAPGQDELLVVPVEVRDPDNRRCEHDVIITFGGTVTPGEVFWIVSDKLSFGAPAAA